MVFDALQIILDIIILVYLYTLQKKVPLSDTKLHQLKPTGYEVPRCVNCNTIQYVSKIGDKFLCRICANHVV